MNWQTIRTKARNSDAPPPVIILLGRSPVSMENNVNAIKTLRGLTGAGVMDCKTALDQSGGDMKKAEEFLREKGIASAKGKASRETNQGLIESYIHSGGRIGALVEANCETDFVARTEDFKELAHSIAMQVAAMAPKYVDSSEIPEAETENPEEVCLLLQPFIRDPSKSVQDLVDETAGKLGENIRIRRFTRFSLGE